MADNADLAKAGRVLILEVKSSTEKSVPYGLTLGTGYNGYQLSDTWLNPTNGVIERMMKIGNQIVRVNGTKLKDIFENTPNKIEKYVVEIDSDGLAKILKVDVL